MKLYEDLIKEFNISEATLNNWVKTKIIKPPKNNEYYTEEEYLSIKNIIQNNKLQNRANRLNNHKKIIYYYSLANKERKNLLKQAVELYQNDNIEKNVLLLAIHILKSSKLLKNDFYIYPKTDLDYFIIDWIKKINIDITNNIYEKLNYYHYDDDFLGCFYQSILSLSCKSKIGSYYTPNYLLKDIKIDINSTILDPCCGSGNILLNILSKNHNQEKIYISDIDETALKICIINLCLFFQTTNINFHYKVENIFYPNFSIKYDYIVTNPPWGSKLNKDIKNDLVKKYGTYESFSIALQNCINLLNNKGILIFFLPISILNVETHKNIRKFLILKNKKIEIDLLGKPFKGVLSESIKLKFYNNINSDYLTIMNNNEKYNYSYSEIITNNFLISIKTNKIIDEIINKIYKLEHITLKNNAEFGLGIVTGNNKKHLLKIKEKNSEPIYKGKDIIPFNFLESKHYIIFQPELYQQIVKPTEKYRERKIVYRFISDKIICALDKEGKLILNSANFFIPKIDYPVETIICLFNSNLYNFIYKNLFYSKKILRSHLEKLPLPIFDKNIHKKFKEIYDYYILVKNKKNVQYNLTKLNNFVYYIFSLSKKEIEIIEKKVNNGKFKK